MSHTRSFVVVALISLVATVAVTRIEQPQPRIVDESPLLHGRDVGVIMAARDTVYLLGGPGRVDGTFETSFLTPDWHGWTHEDISQPVYEPHWHVSDLLAIEGEYSLWCGTWFGDDHGYGNRWIQNLQFVWPLPDATGPVTVAWSGQLAIDTEPGYDYVYLQAWQDDGWTTLTTWDGIRGVRIDESVTLDPAQWTGAEGPAVALRIRFTSDSAWSDEDGLWDTDGAVRADLLQVTIDGVLVDAEDFEDQVSDHWENTGDPTVGDFSQIWMSLFDLDPCVENHTPQVAFIDDGFVVPGTGGSMCITWCYGPGGYVVNTTGGLSRDVELRNVVVSPLLEIPPGHEGVTAAFSVYLHEELAGFEWPWVFFFWEVRATDSDDPADILEASWDSRSLVYYGGPEYRRFEEDVSSLLEPGARWMQLRLGVYDMYPGFWTGHDATPAPYIDNVAVRCWPISGPAISVDESHLAQDTFPASGTIDPANPAANSCRFDMARNLAPVPANIPGDSLVFEVVPVRHGSSLFGPPQMHVVMKPNPVFDAVRTLPPNFTWNDGLLLGYVDGTNCTPDGPSWFFDLPDTGFFYPGDEIRYFVEARDLLDGDQGLTRLPADTTGITSFVSTDIIDTSYPEEFTVHGLPGITSFGGGYFNHPKVLLWFDQDRDRDLILWREALAGCRYDDDPGSYYWSSYDLYRTRSALEGVGNGLGGRATAAQLDGYDYILYDCGASSRYTLAGGANGYNYDPSQDVQLLTAWLEGTDRRLLLCGDDLATDLYQGNAATLSFLTGIVGAQWVTDDVRPLIMEQHTPQVVTLPGAPFPSGLTTWVDYGGCHPIRNFDGVQPVGGALTVAEFADPQGDIGVFPYAAGLLNQNVEHQNYVFFSPSAFAAIVNHQDWIPPSGYPIQARAALLYEWLPNPWTSVDDPQLPLALTVAAYPNPFNPRVTIALDLPRPAAVMVTIYNVRGAVVRSLRAEDLPAGRHELVWNGEDDQGAAAASGVYFYRVQVGGEERRGKLALIR